MFDNPHSETAVRTGPSDFPFAVSR
jgi:hypothetical protein